MKPVPPLLVHVAVLLGVALASAYAAGAPLPCTDGDCPPPQRQRELVELVRQDCGSCHGLTLQGGLGPALLPAALAHKPVEAMVHTVIHGRPGTAMPGWRPFMDEAEAQWVVRALMSGFPEQGAR